MKTKHILLGEGMWVKALVIMFALLLFPFLERAAASVYHVPGDFSSIQQAINGSEEGSTIIVGSGEYQENIYIDKRIILRSEAGPENTTIWGTGTVEGLPIPVVEVPCAVAVEIDGFTITMKLDIGGYGCSEMAGPWPPPWGSGIYAWSGSDLTIKNCIIERNFGIHAGGILCDSCSLTVENSAIKNNNGGDFSGGIEMRKGSLTLINTIISGNEGCNAGGIIARNADLLPNQSNSLRIINSTIANNRRSDGTLLTGIELPYTDSLSIVNSIVWGHLPSFHIYVPGESSVDPNLLDIDITYSDIQTRTSNADYNLFVTQGVTNIDVDPELDNQYHLDRSSRCIDIGNNVALDLPSVDIDGDQRKIDGNLVGGSCDGIAVVDMGADEVGMCDPNLLIANFEVNPPAGTVKVGRPLTVQFTDTSSGNVTSWLWDFGDGDTSTEQNPSHAYYPTDWNENAWDYTVSLTVSDGLSSDTRKVEYAIHLIELPRIDQIWSSEVYHYRRQPINIVGTDFNPTLEFSTGELLHHPGNRDIRYVTIGDITYNIGDPNIITWTGEQITMKVPDYPDSEFRGNDSIVKDVSVTINEYYTSNKMPITILRVFCGDGTCSSTESCSSCEQDCGACPICGDGICNGNETCGNCAQDCGKCLNVIEPNGGDVLYSGDTFTIMLQIDTQGLPGTATREDLHYKCNGDANWIWITTRSCGPGGCYPEYPWEVPLVGATKTGCKVRAKLLDSSGNLLAQDSSQGYFKIMHY